MNKNGVMFGVLGLIAGLVIGFMGANSINRSSAGSSVSTPADAGLTAGSNPALPADHPPIGTSSGDANPMAGAPQVMQAIEKAKQQPNDFEAQMTAADLYYQIQRFDEAAKFYEAAAKLKPAEVEPMVKAGNAYFDGEKFPEAEKWYLQALAKKPNDISVRTDLGLTFYLREPRDIERAIKEYKTSLSLDPKHEITLQNLALAYKEKGDSQNFDQTIAALRAVNPNNPLLTK